MSVTQLHGTPVAILEEALKAAREGRLDDVIVLGLEKSETKLHFWASKMNPREICFIKELFLEAVRQLVLGG